MTRVVLPLPETPVITVKLFKGNSTLRRGGFSSTISYRKMFFEELKIRHDNGQNIVFLLILGIYKILNYWKKKIIK